MDSMGKWRDHASRVGSYFRLRNLILAVAMFLLVDFLWGAQLGIYPSAGSAPAVTVTPDTDSTFPDGRVPALIDDPSQADSTIQGEWYCWDTGPLSPHHLGYHVPNDQLWTWGELRASGFAWTP